jgi:hypothetical protein
MQDSAGKIFWRTVVLTGNAQILFHTRSQFSLFSPQTASYAGQPREAQHKML